MDRLNQLQVFDIFKLLPAVQEDVESQTPISHRVSTRTHDWEFGATDMLNPLFFSATSFLCCLGCKSFGA